MKVGCVKEIKNNEFRVGMTPGCVLGYKNAGHEWYRADCTGKGNVPTSAMRDHIRV